MRFSSKYRDVLPLFAAPEGGRLTEAMLEAYRDAGVIILEGFVPAECCARLRLVTSGRHQCCS